VKPIKHFVKAETNGAFSLWINRPIYKQYGVSEGYIRNAKTGENMGTTVTLHMNLFDNNLNKLENPTFEEDCYEFVGDQDAE